MATDAGIGGDAAAKKNTEKSAEDVFELVVSAVNDAPEASYQCQTRRLMRTRPLRIGFFRLRTRRRYNECMILSMRRSWF